MAEENDDLILEEVDLEHYAQEGKKPPKAKQYRFKVNEVICTWKESTILGSEILEQANFTPPKDYSLRQKIKGETPVRIALADIVDLRKPGLEKFRAIRRGQTEGIYE